MISVDQELLHAIKDGLGKLFFHPDILDFSGIFFMRPGNNE